MHMEASSKDAHNTAEEDAKEVRWVRSKKHIILYYNNILWNRGPTVKSEIAQAQCILYAVSAFAQSTVEENVVLEVTMQWTETFWLETL